MKRLTIATIVEGHGEVEALPVLLRMLRPEWNYAKPVRAKRYQLVLKDNKYSLEHYMRIAASNIQPTGGGLLILIDADDDCPATLGPELQRRADSAMSHIRTLVVLATREFESWLIAGGAITDAPLSPAPDDLPNPKAVVKKHYPKYREPVDQPSLTSRIDLDKASTSSPSFGKLERCLRWFEEQLS